jgi:hypothetical protein
MQNKKYHNKRFQKLFKVENEAFGHEQGNDDDYAGTIKPNYL